MIRIDPRRSCVILAHDKAALMQRRSHLNIGQRESNGNENCAAETFAWPAFFKPPVQPPGAFSDCKLGVFY